MTVKDFLKFVEIKTKVASMVPFFLGSLYAKHKYDTFDISIFFMMFASLLAFDMFVTGLNNFMDYKKAHKKDGYGYEVHNVTHNVVNVKNIKESYLIAMLLILVSVALGFGILLVINTNWIVLLLGMLSFGVGIVYSYGPLPISRTPFGEVFSGFFMGFIIVFLAIYIQVINLDFISISFDMSRADILFKWRDLVEIFLLSVPLMMGISNIMLANNICDVEEDFANKRYTLPIQIGVQKALILFKTLYLFSFLSVIVMAVIGIIPIYGIVVLLAYIIVYKNVKVFEKEQNKATTFETAVINFIVMNGSMIILLIIANILALIGL